MDNSLKKNNIDPEIKNVEVETDGPEEAPEKDDVEIENDEEFSSAITKDAVSKLRQRLKKSDDDKKEYLLGWQKLKADYVNSRRQDEEEKKVFIRYAESDIMSKIIPVLDSFDVALTQGKSLEVVPEEWQKGMEQIRNQLKNILTEHGLTVIDPENTPFNPHESEAIGVSETDDESKDDMVATVLQKGYKLHDRLIRPAKVKVWKCN